MEWSKFNIPWDAQPLFVMLDFDGTLVPIQEHASMCYLPPELAQLLEKLQSKSQTMVGIVSGRSLVDLKPRVSVPSIAYAGNHGLEIEAWGKTFYDAQALAGRVELNRIVQQLEQDLASYEGVWVEHKELSATVHYRQATVATVEHVKTLLEPLQGHQQWVIREGKCISEIRPRTHWHKGHAIQWLMDQFTPPNQQPHLIFIGDDHTDEDAFAMFPDHTTIRVGHSSPTQARYQVRTVDDVHSLIRGFANSH